MVIVIHCDRCNSTISEGGLHIVGGIGALESQDPHSQKVTRYAELCDSCYSMLELWLRGL